MAVSSVKVGPDKVMCHLMFRVLSFTVLQLLRLVTQQRSADAHLSSLARQPAICYQLARGDRKPATCRRTLGELG